MKKLLIALLLLGGMVQAQTFDFECEEDDLSNCLDGHPTASPEGHRNRNGGNATIIQPDWVYSSVRWDDLNGRYEIYVDKSNLPEQFDNNFTILSPSIGFSHTIAAGIDGPSIPIDVSYTDAIAALDLVNMPIRWRVRDNCTLNADGVGVTVAVDETAVLQHPERADFVDGLQRWGSNTNGEPSGAHGFGRFIVAEFTNRPYRVIVRSSSTTVNFTPEYHYPDESSYFFQRSGKWYFGLDMGNDVYEPLANTNSVQIQIDNLSGGDPSDVQNIFWEFNGPYELDVRMHPNECNDILITGYSPSAYGGLEYRYKWTGGGGIAANWYHDDGAEDLDNIIHQNNRYRATHLIIQVRSRFERPNSGPRGDDQHWTTITSNGVNQLAQANVGADRFEETGTFTSYRIPYHAWEIGNNQETHGQTMDIYIDPNNTNLEIFVANPVTDPTPNAEIRITHFTNPLTVTQPYGSDFRYQFRAWSPVLNRWIYASDDNDRPNLSDNSSYWRTKGYMIVPAGTEVQVRIRSRGQCTTSWQGN